MKIVKVQDAMTLSVVTLRPSDTVHEAAGLLADAGVSGAPVVEGGTVVGMLSETDILRVVAPLSVDRPRSLFELLMSRGNVMVHGGSGPVVRDVMTRAVRSIRPGASLWEAADQMQRAEVNRLPVVDEDGALVGIVSRADIVRLVGRSDAAIRAEVLAAIGTIEEETASHPVVGLEVSVDDGIVTIRGLATAPWAKRVLARMAALTPGAFGVSDEASMESSQTA
jgi:CBS domain-containing protein